MINATFFIFIILCSFVGWWIYMCEQAQKHGTPIIHEQRISENEYITRICRKLTVTVFNFSFTLFGKSYNPKWNIHIIALQENDNEI